MTVFIVGLAWLSTGWTAANMGAFFGLLKVTGLFRVDPKDEEEGLDHSYHGGSAYEDNNGEYKPSYAKVRGPFPSPPLNSLYPLHNHSCWVKIGVGFIT